MQLYFGFPNEWGHFPFLLHHTLSDKHFVFSGSTLPSDEERILLLLEENAFREMSTRIESDLTQVSLDSGLWLLDGVFQSLVSEEYFQLRACEPNASKPIALPKYNELTASQTLPLMDPKRGCFFGISPSNLSDGLKAVKIAKKNPIEQQRRILDAAIETVSNMAVTEKNRGVWLNALIAISIIAESNGDEELKEISLQNAVGFASAKKGAEIPFVKDWVSRQLLSGVALARMVSKAEAQL